MTTARIKEAAERNAHIPTDEILADIRDTEAEIRQWTAEAEAWEKLPIRPEHRWDHMRASARRTRIKEAEEFIADLRAILEYRDSK